MRQYKKHIMFSVIVLVLVITAAYTYTVIAAPISSDVIIAPPGGGGGGITPTPTPTPTPEPLEILWDAPARNDILSGSIEARVRVFPVDIIPVSVTWCSNPTTQATCDPSTGSAMSKGTANVWSATWDTTSESDGQYTMCARVDDGTDTAQICQSVSISNTPDGPNADLNCDGIVDVQDLGIILSWFNGKVIDGDVYPNRFSPGAQSDGTYKHPCCGGTCTP